MRIRLAARARARSSTNEVILLTRTRVRPARVSMKSGSIPYWVIVGPRCISTTWAGTPNDARVSSITLAFCISRFACLAIGAAGSKIFSMAGKIHDGSGADKPVPDVKSLLPFNSGTGMSGNPGLAFWAACSVPSFFFRVINERFRIGWKSFGNSALCFLIIVGWTRIFSV